MKNTLKNNNFYMLEYYQYNGKSCSYYEIKEGRRYTYDELLTVILTIDNNSEDFDIEILDDCILVTEIREGHKKGEQTKYTNICDIFNKSDLTEARVFADPDE